MTLFLQPFAAAKITKRLFEVNKRGYWDATEEELEKLKEAHLQIEAILEERL